MCGFLGIIDFDQQINLPAFKKSLEKVKHRGPDSSCIWSESRHATLGHNRLSIIDTSTNGNQPMESSNKEVIIVFNGEIYNYEELKNNLTFSNFKSTSDTETILEGYVEQGTSFFKKLRGIYSFAIIDRRKGVEIILVRDPSGVKPLYYHLTKTRIVFGSEIKALKPLMKNNLDINQTAIKQYLNLGFIPEPNTAFQQISALNPGNYLRWSSKSNLIQKQFFKFKYDDLNSNSYSENIEKTFSLLEIAVKRNLVSDVSINLSLSGGIDSSLIYYLANKQNKDIFAQTISFSKDQDFDESEISKIYANHIDGKHKIYNLSKDIDLDLIDKIFLHFDQPYADTSAIPTYFINKHASKSTKVMLGGDGGDELFNGYPSQTILSLLLPLRKIRFLWGMLNSTKAIFSNNMYRKVNRVINLMGKNKNVFDILYNSNSWFPMLSSINGESAFKNRKDQKHIEDYESLFSDEIPRKLNNKIIFDYFRKTLLSDYLRKTDMMSMMNGVEWRVPMLDEDLTSFAFTIPFKQKSSISKYKKPLREIHSRIFPKNTTNLQKSGFGIPLDKYIKLEDKKFICNEILKPESISHQYLNKNYLKLLSEQFFEYNNPSEISRNSVFQRIMIVYLLQRWIDNV